MLVFLASNNDEEKGGHCTLTGSFHVDLLYGNNRQVHIIYLLIKVLNVGGRCMFRLAQCDAAI